LLFRGAMFSHKNGKDWTVVAFLRAASLDLDVSVDAKTAEAAVRAAEVLAGLPIGRLRHRRLEASDFDDLLVEDVPGQVLRWLDGPDACKQELGPLRWQAFAAACKHYLGFDVDSQGALVAAERLAGQQGAWQAVWRRFADAPAKYPKLPDLLDQAAPPASPSVAQSEFPCHDRAREDGLRKALLSLDCAAPHIAAGELRDLEGQHGPRRHTVWAALGRAPLVQSLAHLVSLVDITDLPFGAGSADALRDRYVAAGWRADLAVLRALAAVRHDADVAAVTAAIHTVYLPWLTATATALQQHIAAAPTLSSLRSSPIKVGDGECLLFADGLRFDVGHLLSEALQQDGCAVAMTTRWAGLPTVTATCKPAISPIATAVLGTPQDTEFQPHAASSGKPLTSIEFRALLCAADIQVLAASETGNPEGRAWTEHGALDKMGHEQQWKLAWRIDEEVVGLAQRVCALLDSGWKRVRVVTDHGWLLVPGGLPKVDLHANLAQTRWGRCAVLKDGALAPYPVGTWSWSATVPIVIAPGVATFMNGYEYAHGGWSLQEAVVPILDVSRPTAPGKVAVSLKWKRLACTVIVEGSPPGSRVDMRTQVAQPASSLVLGGKAIDNGQVRLLVEDDGQAGAAVHIVVLGPGGTPLFKMLTVVGGNE
jgi:hypothetical protein